MSDLFRLVRLSSGGRPVVVRDLQNGSTYARTKSTLDFAPGPRNQQQAGGLGRYSGKRATGEREDNGTLSWTALVSGGSIVDQTNRNADLIVADFEGWAAGLLIEFRAEGATYSTFYDLRGPATWKPTYDWAQMTGAKSMQLDFQVPIAPLALLAPCDIFDDFSVNTLGTIVPGAGTYAGVAAALLPDLWWRLGDTVGSGSVADASGHGRIGTPGAGVTLGVAGGLTGDSDTAASLNNASNGKITSTYNPFAGDFTVKGRSIRDATTDSDVIWGADQTAGPFLRCDSASLNVTFDNDGTSGAGALAWTAAWPATAVWVDWMFTFNSSTFVGELWINGVSQGTKTFAAIGTPSGNFQVGMRGAATDPFGGDHDEIMVFTRVLTSGEYLSLYNAAQGIFTGGPFVGGDYTLDVGTSSDLAISGGQMTPIGTLASELRARHTVRGYKHLEHQETRKFTPGATITSFKGGAILCGSDTANYVDVYVDDNGTNSRLRVDVIVAGVRTNRSSTNLAARVVNGTAFWVRGRREGNVIYAEYFTVAAFPSGPTPMGSPTLAANYTLSAPEITAIVAGYGGFTWIPQASGARMDDYESLPRTWRNQTLPAVLQMSDAIPGTAPALMDATVTPSGGSAAPIWAMIAWAARAGAPVSGAVAPFGIIPAENGTSLSGWSVQADATYRGGSGLKATASGAGTFTASYGIDPSTLPADVFTDKELRVEVWARVDLASTLVTPTLKATVQPGAGLNFGPERQTLEWGTTGKQLTKPSSGSAKRQVSLGVLPLITESALKWNLVLTGTVAAGSSGTYGVDDIFLVVRRQRALMATAKPNDGTNPKFVISTNETSKTVRSNGQGRVAQPPAASYPDAGLGGSLMEVPVGALDVMLELSSLIPDDPTSDTTSEQLSHSATVHYSITPRIFVFRGT